MQKHVLVHAPDLNTPGGKQTYYSSIKDHFDSEVSFFFYGAKGRKESRMGVVRRLTTDYVKFYRQLRKEDYCLVLLNPSLNPKSFFRDSIFALISRTCRKKTIVFWRGWNKDFEENVVNKIRPYYHWTFGQADASIVLAQEFQDRLSEYGYTKPMFRETTVVNDTILDFKVPEDFEKRTINLLFLARVEKVKGIYESIDSFQRLKVKYPNLVLNIGGVGGELEPAKAYVAQKGIKDINFLGWITGQQKTEILHTSDIYLFPSYHGEGMPNSVLEAMASGLSLVTTDVGGIKDFFIPKKMGVLVSPKDSTDLEEKIESLIKNEKRREESGAFNAQYAKDHFSPKQVVKRLETIFTKTLSA